MLAALTPNAPQVYVTILASLPPSAPGFRSSINHNFNDILELHDELLGELHRAVPHSEYTQPDPPFQRTLSNPQTRGDGHRRWRSVHVVPEGRDGISSLRNVPGMAAEPQTAAEVAKLFLKRVSRRVSASSWTVRADTLWGR